MEVWIDYEDLKACFEDFQDPRVARRTTHRLEAILFLTLYEVTCVMDDWESIEQWGNNLVQLLRRFIEVSNGIPSHDLISRVFAALDNALFQQRFVLWMSTLVPSLEGQIAAIDGEPAAGCFKPLNLSQTVGTFEFAGLSEKLASVQFS